MTRALPLALVICACVARVAAPPPEGPRDLVVSEDDCEGAPEEYAVSHEAVLADLATVERILRDGWAGFGERRKEGVDWTATFAALRDGVAGLPDPVSADALRKYLAAGLVAAKDNHLSFWWVDARGARHQSSASPGHLDAWTTDGGAGEGAFLARAPLRVEKRPLQLALASPGPQWRRLEGGPRDKSDKAYERTGNVLRVRTLDVGRGAELQAFARAGTELRDAPWILIDLRGNQGGGDGPALEFVLQLTQGTFARPPIERLSSDVTEQGELNVAICEAARPDLDREARLAFEKERDALAAKLNTRKHRNWSMQTQARVGLAPAPFTRPVVLLVDRRCASSCESAITFARQLPGAVVVGENTAGTGVFGEAFEYRLPRTGLWMRAGTKYFHGWDETKGFLPDFWIDDPDPAGLARELAECLARPDCPIRK